MTQDQLKKLLMEAWQRGYEQGLSDELKRQGRLTPTTQNSSADVMTPLVPVLLAAAITQPAIAQATYSEPTPSSSYSDSGSSGSFDTGGSF